MDEEVYKHMPKWRRVIRDLALEAGLKKFVTPSDTHDQKSTSDPDPFSPENGNDRSTDPSQTRKPNRAGV